MYHSAYPRAETIIALDFSVASEGATSQSQRRYASIGSVLTICSCPPEEVTVSDHLKRLSLYLPLVSQLGRRFQLAIFSTTPESVTLHRTVAALLPTLIRSRPPGKAASRIEAFVIVCRRSQYVSITGALVRLSIVAVRPLNERRIRISGHRFPVSTSGSGTMTSGFLTAVNPFVSAMRAFRMRGRASWRCVPGQLVYPTTWCSVSAGSISSLIRQSSLVRHSR